MKDIVSYIDNLVAEKTFGLEALDGIKKIKDAHVEALKTIEELQEQLAERAAECRSIRSENTDLEDALKQAKQQIADMEKTVRDGQKAIYDADKHYAVANAYKHSLEVVFRPAVMRETVTKNVPVTQPHGGVITVQESTTTLQNEE